MAFSGYQDFNPDFSSALQNMIAQRPGISIYSGYRSPERQAELYSAAIQKYGSPEAARKWVAPPGHSRHNMGIAADLAFVSPEDRAWAHENAGQFGLNFRMGHEPWHIELVGGGSDGSQPQAVAVSNETKQPLPQADQERILAKGFEFTPRANNMAATESVAGTAGDINQLAGLLSSKQSSQAKDILERIRGYS
jgi:hypothetical protein